MSLPFHQQIDVLIPPNPSPAFQDDLPSSKFPGGSGMNYFHALHHDRAYLLNSLQHENLKATDLLRRRTILEENLAKGNFIFSKRKMRSQVGWLTSRIQETGFQEKAILAQLGRVTYQIQRRERQIQVENEIRQIEVQVQDPSDNNEPVNQTPQLYLNPALPAFEHADFTANQDQHMMPEWEQENGDYDWQQSTHDRLARNSQTEEISPMDQASDSHEESGFCDSSRPALGQRTVSMNDAPSDTCCLQHTHSPRWKVKRLSLPTLPDISQIWHLTADDEGALSTESGPRESNLELREEEET
ncbi:uncharacterized protein LY89DRAFT_685218 [Mollisia scopiformis]|uniref:Uncharacterized protein n=1 Tax=Mollisia scopiformis TaxID=149040 RepID=A0A194X7N8_MOLSC|nr:uncharacterized protein LY89DRAFT_685218 [Mollisia scopiformis]KUJ16181.1 hypothetical protein LY89DRAFT_685218 [Mollisia scopiformis]